MRARGISSQSVPTGLARCIAFGALLCVAACGARVSNDAIVQDGWDTYGNATHVTCGTRPVLLDGDHTDIVVAGPCQKINISGAHNDISVTLASGGEIVISGHSNDVTWHLLPGAWGQPKLVDNGDNNTFHAGK